MKKALSFLLALVMLIGVIPLTVSAVDVDTAETGAPGSSADNPLYVRNFAQLKEALEKNGTYYIEVNSFENTTGYDFYDLKSNVDFVNNGVVIAQNGVKHLEINTTIDCRARGVETTMFCFIHCLGNLYISGSGSLNVSFNANLYSVNSSNSIIYVQEPGKLQVDGDVTLDARSKSVDAHGCAIDNHSGKVTLNGGHYYGCGLLHDNGSRYIDAEAVFTNIGETVINGGVYQAELGQENFGILNHSDSTVLNGGTFYGIWYSTDSEKALSELLGEYRGYRELDTGKAFDGTAINKTEKAVEVCDTRATITFTPNGGTGTMEPVYVEKGSTYTLPACTFTPPANKVFSKWAVNGTISFGNVTQITVNEDTVLEAQWKDAPSGTYSISGDVTSYLEASDNTSIMLSKKSGDNYAFQALRTISGNSGSYSFTGLSNGQYKLRVSKKNHVTREYNVTVLLGSKTQDVKIHPIGDVDGDGSTTTFDFALANSHAKGVSMFTDDYELACANIDGEGDVSTFDAAMINSHAKGVSKLY